MDKFVIKNPKKTNLSLAEPTQPGNLDSEPNSQENVMEKSKKKIT